MSRASNRLHSLLDDLRCAAEWAPPAAIGMKMLSRLDHMLRKTLAVYQMAVLGVSCGQARSRIRDAVCRVRASNLLTDKIYGNNSTSALSYRYRYVHVGSRHGLCLVAADIVTLLDRLQSPLFQILG